MKNKIYPLLLLVCLLQIISCKKDAQHQPQKQQIRSLETGLVSFSVNGQLIPANIDTTANKITVVIPRTLDEHNLTARLTLANQVIATINNNAVNSSAIIDFSKPVTLTVASADKSRFTSFSIIAVTDLQYFGLEGNIVAEKSLNKDYEFYFDQFDGSTFQATNCGPASTTMAIKWADSTFAGKPADARNMLLPQGGWWNNGQIQSYLRNDGIDNIIDTISNLKDLVKSTIDNNNVLILNPDMNYIPYNDNGVQHINKFYQTTTPGWGHYFLVKGYKEVNTLFFLEVYDPYSDGLNYAVITDGQLKGKDRYYNSDDVNSSTLHWWPYAIIIAPKGQKVIASTHFTLNSLGKPKAIPISYGR